MNRGDIALRLWELYENALSYQTSMGIRRRIPEYVRFYEGDQWPAPTRNTKNLPRPVINIVKMICRLKKSAILSSPIRIIYKCADKSVNVQRLNSFSDTVLKELDQDAIDKCAIDDGVKKGSYFYHYYWDTEKISADGSEGGIGCELIDPLNIFFENPCQLDEQKQKWIIIASREPVSEIVSKCDSETDISLIAPDSISEREHDNGLCTVLTVYYRNNGEVMCVRTVRGTVIKAPFSITPNTALAREALGMDSADVRRARATLYPVVCGYYEKKDRCIYGLSEVEGLIPNQKAINFNIAMALLNAQEVAWGKYIALPGALKGQVISNSPGQVLIDHTGTGNGIKRMQDNYMQSFPVDLVSTVTDLTRSVTGTSEFMTGETTGSGMSGTAIARLQSQAQLPIEELRSTFMSVKRKQGRVLAQFYKLHFPFAEFFYEEGEEYKRDSFSSYDYESARLEVTVETVLGVGASMAGDITMLDTVLKAGLISLETYIRAYPDNALTDKKRILTELETEKSSEIACLKNELSSVSSLLETERATKKK